eukprot:scaffold322060_cov30-Tisochrysis_lutea.AAC.1
MAEASSLSAYDRLAVRAASWAFEPGLPLSCEVAMRAGSAADERWLEWLSAQLCGFLYCGDHDEETPEDGTALPDERQRSAARRSCFLASAPHVLLAGRRLLPEEELVLNVGGMLPTGLPPSHAGNGVSIEYFMVVTARMMRPPAKGKTEWKRGAIHRLSLPLLVLLSAARGLSPAVSTRLKHPSWQEGSKSTLCNVVACSIDCVNVHIEDVAERSGALPADATAHVGWILDRGVGSTLSNIGREAGLGSSFDAEQREQDEEEPEESAGAEAEERRCGQGACAQATGSRDSNAVDMAQRAKRFLVAVDGTPLASISLLDGAVHQVGGVIHGIVRFEAPRAGGALAAADARSLFCRSLDVTLEIEEEFGDAMRACEGGDAPLRASAVVSSTTVPAGPVVSASFELLIPRHMPPAFESPAVTVRWLVRFRFHLVRGSFHQIARPSGRLLSSFHPARRPSFMTLKGDPGLRPSLGEVEQAGLSIAALQGCTAHCTGPLGDAAAGENNA